MLVFVGSAAGALLLQFFPNDWLKQILPILLIGIAVFLALRPDYGKLAGRPRGGKHGFNATCLGIGTYDGFIGPGTGTFLTMSSVMLQGKDLMQATAQAKPLNFTTNLAAVLIFIFGGHVVWKIGLLMALGQFAGGWVGAQIIVKTGTKLVRWMIVIVCSAMSLKLIFG